MKSFANENYLITVSKINNDLVIYPHKRKNKKHNKNNKEQIKINKY